MLSTGTTLPSASDVLHDHHRGGVRFQGPEDVRRVARVGDVVAGAEVGWLTGRADLRPAGAEHHVFRGAGIVWLGEPRFTRLHLYAVDVPPGARRAGGQQRGRVTGALGVGDRP